MTTQRFPFNRYSTAAAAFIALCGVSPAFGATLDLPLAPPDYLLGSLLLALIVALGLSLTRGHPVDGQLPEGPDMRWWKNSHS